MGAVRGHAVLSIGPDAVATRNLWGTGGIGREIEASGIIGGAGACHPVLRQRTSALATLPNRFPATSGEMSAGGGQSTGEEEAEVSFQKQAAEFGCHGDCPVRLGL